MISAFVPTLNNGKTIRRVLQGIKAQTVTPEKIIVIDSGSTDNTEEIVRSEGVQFFPKEHFGDFDILGLGRARNRILELIDTPYLLSVDSDIILNPDHIERLLPMMEADPQLGGIAGKQIELNRTEMGDRCRAVVDMRDIYKPVDEYESEFRDFILGSNNIYRTEALHKVGLAENGNKFRPFEDSFMSNYEDVDIGIKLRKHGYRLLWESSVHTYHLQKDDVRTFINRAYRYRVFKWLLKGAFEDEILYRRKVEHNINYVKMGLDIITEKSRWYLAYPFFLAGFTFFLEDILRFGDSKIAGKIYGAFFKSLDYFKSEELKEGVLGYNSELIKSIKVKPDGIDEEVFDWFLSLAELTVFDKKFPAMHDRKLSETDIDIKIKALEMSKKRMEYEAELNIYGESKVLLANVPNRDKDYFAINAGSRWPHSYDMARYDANIPPYIPYPFFMGHTFSLLQKSGVSSWIIDGVAEGYLRDEFLYEAFGYAPELLVVEISALSLGNDISVIGDLKRFLPDMKVCVVGAHASYLGEDVLSDIVDFVIIGEYEEAVVQLSKNINSSERVINGGGVDFKSLPSPERLVTPFYNYNDRPVESLEYPSMQVQLSRGCPYRCSFCLWVSSLYDKKYRTADVASVVSEIEQGIKNFGIRSFYLDDDTFNVDKSHLEAFCDELESRDIRIPWMAMARADGGVLDKDLIVRMKSLGLVGLKFGIESTDEDVLFEIGKKLDIRECEETIALCKETGVEVHLTFSIGYLADTKEKIKATFDWMISQSPDSQQVSIVAPFPGTPMYEKLIQKGLIDDNIKYDGHNSYSFDNGMGSELVRIKDEWNAEWERFKRG